MLRAKIDSPYKILQEAEAARGRNSQMFFKIGVLKDFAILIGKRFT